MWQTLPPLLLQTGFCGPNFPFFFLFSYGKKVFVIIEFFISSPILHSAPLNYSAFSICFYLCQLYNATLISTMHKRARSMSSWKGVGGRKKGVHGVT